MLIRRPDDVPASEITPEGLHLDRRRFIAAAVATSAAAIAACAPDDSRVPAADDLAEAPAPPRAEITPFEDATAYNNFYELGIGKEDPKANAAALHTSPWSVSVVGLVRRPATYALDDLLRGLAAEERVYRHRCVEGWSMVIPWLGVPLGTLLRRLDPLPSATWVELTSLADPASLPGQRTNVLPWPYTEALRLDEALHPLTLLATGMYGRTLPNQNGAPLRLVVPWKYGFKGAKSIVRIRLSERRPTTTWNVAAPNEYGFWANVNPAVDHPRWSQAKERRVGEFRRRRTLPFNGYAGQVASLYDGMDLRRDF